MESTEEFVMGDEDVTREADWDEDDHIAPGTVRVRCVELAVEEETDTKDKVNRRFNHDFQERRATVRRHRHQKTRMSFHRA
jgi:hypothetical protein